MIYHAAFSYETKKVFVYFETDRDCSSIEFPEFMGEMLDYTC